MSENESQLPSEQAAKPRVRSKLRRFFLRHVPLAIGSMLVLLVLAVTGLYFLMSSARFERVVRNRLVTELEQATGGRVEIAAFHWQLLQLMAEADGLVIHGREVQGEDPLGSIEHLRARVSLLGLWSPSVRLRDLSIEHPVFHLIVYPDGTTNVPSSIGQKKSSTRPLDAFFDLKAGHVSVRRGIVEIADRAADFDFQNRHAPLNLDADSVAIQLRYVPASGKTPETYRVDAGATDVNLARTVAGDVSGKKPKPVHGYFQATLDLTRSAAYLRSLRLTARDSDKTTHTLDISGALQDFTHPSWQARVLGDLDMRLLNPITGYPYAPEGIAHLNLNSSGHDGEFGIDGKIHVENGSYIGPGANAAGIRLDANVHADQKRLLITSIAVRLRPGGQVEGSVDLSPWISPLPGATVMEAAPTGAARGKNHRMSAPAPPPGTIPMDGKVMAEFKDVTLDTILDMESAPPFQRLGIASLVNGKANATWVNGENNTVIVTANLTLRPSSHPLAGEVPGTGMLDATYMQRNGSVDVRRLELHLPASDMVVHGALGAYPISSASSLQLDFHTRNLGEFDTVFRSLGLQRKGKSGTAALPISLAGQADFQGSWAGSLANPRLAGNLKATQLDLEMSPLAAESNETAQPRIVHLDSIDASGSYSSTRITVDHGVVQRGDTKVSMRGALAAVQAPSPAVRTQTAANRASGTPVFDQNAILDLRLDAAKVNADDLQTFVSQKLPFTGRIDTELQLDGPLRAPAGSGWVQLEAGSLYGEPVNRLRAQGKMADSVITLSSISIANDAGAISATGSYDLRAKRFQLDANGTSLDVSKLNLVRQKNWGATGRLTFKVHGAGTLDDPQLQGTMSLANLALGGEPVGSLQMNAHTVDHALVYDASTRLDAAVLDVHGQTTLKPDYETQARIGFSQFNIDSILRLTQVKQLSGESALAGVITLEGPLAHPEQLHGEVRLQELEATVAGVHLKSEGGVHATLANERIRLDPLHVTGEDTDLRAQGTLALTGDQQLDLAASGSVNLKLAQMLDSDLTASGNTTFQVEARGPVKKPSLQGRVNIDNGSVSFGDLPNGLSQLRGRLEFNQDRLEVRSLTAMSGGGPLSLGGYLSYQHGLYADLSVTGKGVRIRYPQGISSLADATMHLQGSQSSMLLSGDVLITRFSISPDMDFAALAAQAKSGQGVVSPNQPTNRVRLDVRIHSSPQLNFQNAFAKLAGDVDLHLRGTVATPSLLGRVSVTEGSAIIAGTRYDLQRGDIIFTNPVRIEPTIDLSANARVEDYDITLTLHGTPDKLAVTYRSDPPMPEADVVALLALGRTGNEQRLYTQQQEQALSNPTTDALLGGALNATVSSRVQRLFGAGSVKVDPNYLGPFGNSTSRIIVEEQLGRNVTLTYATDVNTTGQQLLQAEIAINRHVSLLVARDEAGVFSMVVKATRRFR